MTRLSSFTSLVLVAAALLAGCRQQKPPTVVPPPPVIETFSVSESRLDAPGPVTITWATTNATRIELTRAGQEPLDVPVDQLSGTLEVQVERSTVFVLVARGDGGSEARAVSVSVGEQASALTLVALPAMVEGGATTTLAWTAPGASSVTLTAGSTVLDTRGQVSSGALVVRPDRDTVYTLTDGTRTATASVTVQVAMLSLTANPPTAQVGQNLTLSWTSVGADRLVITSPGRGQLTEITDVARLASGSFVDVVPALPTNGLVTYEATAFKGTVSRSKTLTVYVGNELSIARFDVPRVAKAGGFFVVRWTTLAADRVQVHVDGQPIYETPTAQLAVQGVFTFVAPMGDFEVTLVARNDRGEEVRQSAQVDAVGVPTTATLGASATTVPTGTPVVLTWTAAEARRVRIVDSDNLAVFSTTGQGAEGGTATVYPSTSTTYTLTADNQLGDAPVTATLAMTVTGTPPSVSQVPATAILNQFVEVRPSMTGALLYGFPHRTVLTSPTVSNFIDIRTTGQIVLEQGSDVAVVRPDFTTRLWGGRREGPLTIQRSGWMGWGASTTNDPSETALPSTSAPAGIIAPYWDDLRLVAGSAVLMEVVGDAPEQRLIVQWDKLQVGTDADTEVTFQVQVHQAGLVSFHYQTMRVDGTPAFTVGMQNDERSVGFDLPDVPQSSSAIYFFSPLSVPPELKAVPSTWGGFIKTGPEYAYVSRPMRVVQVPTQITVSELMFRPAASVTAGQYVEAVNLTTEDWDLSGWVLRSNDGTSFTLPNGTTLPANGQLVVGASLDPAQNDDAGVTVSWAGSGFSLGFDAGSVEIGTTDAGYRIPFSGPADAGTGASLEFDPGLFIAPGASTPVTDTCWASSTFGSQVPSQRGSPGRSAGCGFFYERRGVVNKFHDISSTGTVLLSSMTNVENQYYLVTLAAQASDPAPRLFGTRTPTITVNSNGWLSPRTITVAGSTNKTSLNATEPVGTIAPFWDHLEALGGRSTIHWQRLEPGVDPLTPERHWIVQWTHFKAQLTSDSTPDDLTFQAKLFEDGTIEFHYREMRSGSSSAYGEGASATVWIEQPNGARAIVISTSDRFVRDNTALRFVAR